MPQISFRRSNDLCSNTGLRRGERLRDKVYGKKRNIFANTYTLTRVRGLILLGTGSHPVYGVENRAY